MGNLPQHHGQVINLIYEDEGGAMGLFTGIEEMGW
jgi:hypothetical protein